jgi:hypothetical protein
VEGTAQQLVASREAEGLTRGRRSQPFGLCMCVRGLARAASFFFFHFSILGWKNEKSVHHPIGVMRNPPPAPSLRVRIYTSTPYTRNTTPLYHENADFSEIFGTTGASKNCKMIL